MGLFVFFFFPAVAYNCVVGIRIFWNTAIYFVTGTLIYCLEKSFFFFLICAIQTVYDIVNLSHFVPWFCFFIADFFQMGINGAP